MNTGNYQYIMLNFEHLYTDDTNVVGFSIFMLLYTKYSVYSASWDIFGCLHIECNSTIENLFYLE